MNIKISVKKRKKTLIDSANESILLMMKQENVDENSSRMVCQKKTKRIFCD